MTPLPHSIVSSSSLDSGGTTSVRPLRKAKKLSVVVPCYNELDSLAELARRVANACKQCVGDDYELILVNDCSTDGTWAEIVRLSAGTRQVVGVDLAHNHGHQLALTAGLFVAGGDRVLIIDADLQDPPELLAEMMARLDAGADVAYGQRLQRTGESWFKKASAAFFYRLLRQLADAPIPADTGDFRLMKRQVVDVLLAMPSSIGSFAEWSPGLALDRCRCPISAMFVLPARLNIRCAK